MLAHLSLSAPMPSISCLYILTNVDNVFPVHFLSVYLFSIDPQVLFNAGADRKINCPHLPIKQGRILVAEFSIAIIKSPIHGYWPLLPTTTAPSPLSSFLLPSSSTFTELSHAPPFSRETMAAATMNFFNIFAKSSPSTDYPHVPRHAKVSTSKHNGEPVSKESTPMQQVLSQRYSTIPVITAQYFMHTMQHQSQVFDAKSTHLKINQNSTLFNIAPWTLDLNGTDLPSSNDGLDIKNGVFTHPSIYEESELKDILRACPNFYIKPFGYDVRNEQLNTSFIIWRHLQEVFDTMKGLENDGVHTTCWMVVNAMEPHTTAKRAITLSSTLLPNQCVNHVSHVVCFHKPRKRAVRYNEKTHSEPSVSTSHVHNNHIVAFLVRSSPWERVTDHIDVDQISTIHKGVQKLGRHYDCSADVTVLRFDVKRNIYQANIDLATMPAKVLAQTRIANVYRFWKWVNATFHPPSMNKWVSSDEAYFPFVKTRAAACPHLHYFRFDYSTQLSSTQPWQKSSYKQFSSTYTLPPVPCSLQHYRT